MFEIMPLRARRELESLRREMDRIWEGFFGARPLEEVEAVWAPSLDVKETKDKLIVQAELPGIDPKDVSISLSGGLLTIKGEKKQEKEEKEENYHLVERSYGNFVRSIRIPVGVEEDKIEASYKKGVLKITLPKSEKDKPKEIKVKVV
jgi:HSP20 family protein